MKKLLLFIFVLFTLNACSISQNEITSTTMPNQPADLAIDSTETLNQQKINLVFNESDFPEGVISEEMKNAISKEVEMFTDVGGEELVAYEIINAWESKSPVDPVFITNIIPFMDHNLGQTVYILFEIKVPNEASDEPNDKNNFFLILPAPFIAPHQGKMYSLNSFNSAFGLSTEDQNYAVSLYFEQDIGAPLLQNAGGDIVGSIILDDISFTVPNQYLQVGDYVLGIRTELQNAGIYDAYAAKLVQSRAIATEEASKNEVASAPLPTNTVIQEPIATIASAIKSTYDVTGLTFDNTINQECEIQFPVSVVGGLGTVCGTFDNWVFGPVPLDGDYEMMVGAEVWLNSSLPVLVPLATRNLTTGNMQLNGSLVQEYSEFFYDGNENFWSNMTRLEPGMTLNIVVAMPVNTLSGNSTQGFGFEDAAYTQANIDSLLVSGDTNEFGNILWPVIDINERQ